MASKVKLFRRLVTSNRRSFCLHKNASNCALLNNHLKPALPIQNHHCHPGLTINTLPRHRVYFQRHSTNSSQEAVIHNHGLISDWHTRCLQIIALFFSSALTPLFLAWFLRCQRHDFVVHRESTEACLLLRLRPGDLVEFDREVVVGTQI